MTDSVTVARPHEDRVVPAVIYGLYLFGAFSVLLTVFIGLIVAYAQRGSAGERMETHYTFLIRTFWLTIWWFVIGIALILFGIPLLIVLIGLPMIIVGGVIVSVVGIWFIVRTCVGLYYLSRDEAYPRPMSWLF
ncbi:hypothetical protein GVN21_01435 [Caulobacter sp. SLTY]|uniref:DUF4870 family protein n=1 Tax=Caulobacter sp. SLTY TaxID=2683262 RepID=UPI0014123771|nr:hypothetical protein [Caulobacter sp. SLTY]NBB14013.1 hypothetical protein [Caulobacter sp. SLTY]